MRTAEEIIDGFNPNEKTEDGAIDRASGCTISFWVSAEDKALYDQIQKLSKRRFSKTFREVFRYALRTAAEKAS